MRLIVYAWVLIPVTGSGHLKGLIRKGLRIGNRLGNRVSGGLLMNLRGDDTEAPSISPSNSPSAIQTEASISSPDPIPIAKNEKDAKDEDKNKNGKETDTVKPPQPAPIDAPLETEGTSDLNEEIGSTIAPAPKAIEKNDKDEEKNKETDETKPPQSAPTNAPLETEGNLDSNEEIGSTVAPAPIATEKFKNASKDIAVAPISSPRIKISDAPTVETEGKASSPTETNEAGSTPKASPAVKSGDSTTEQEAQSAPDEEENKSEDDMDSGKAFKESKESKTVVAPSATPDNNSSTDATESEVNKEKNDKTTAKGTTKGVDSSNESKGNDKGVKGDSLSLAPPTVSPDVIVQEEGFISSDISTIAPTLAPSGSSGSSLLATLNSCSEVDLCDDLPLGGALLVGAIGLSASGYWMSNQLDNSSCDTECTLAVAIAARKVAGWQCGSVCEADTEKVFLPSDIPSIVPISSSGVPSDVPSDQPSMLPSDVPSSQPSTSPADSSNFRDLNTCDEYDACDERPEGALVSGRTGYWMSLTSDDGVCITECSFAIGVVSRKLAGWKCGTSCA